MILLRAFGIFAPKGRELEPTLDLIRGGEVSILKKNQRTPDLVNLEQDNIKQG